MTWQLMWRNVRVAALNAMLQLLVIYRFVLFCFVCLFLIFIFKLKKLTQNPKTELKKLWVGLDCGIK